MHCLAKSPMKYVNWHHPSGKALTFGPIAVVANRKYPVRAVVCVAHLMNVCSKMIMKTYTITESAVRCTLFTVRFYIYRSVMLGVIIVK